MFICAVYSWQEGDMLHEKEKQAKVWADILCFSTGSAVYMVAGDRWVASGFTFGNAQPHKSIANIYLQINWWRDTRWCITAAKHLV